MRVPTQDEINRAMEEAKLHKVDIDQLTRLFAENETMQDSVTKSLQTFQKNVLAERKDIALHLRALFVSAMVSGAILVLLMPAEE